VKPAALFLVMPCGCVANVACALVKGAKPGWGDSLARLWLKGEGNLL
jgi:hypothetical protein